jgi:UMF1 family MFS transporter
VNFFQGRKCIITAWCIYDWAAAAFPIIVTTFIFATYFTTGIAANEIKGTYQWANATALAGVLIAVLSPIFGAIADYSGRHKRWLLFFTLICIISTALLWYAKPEINYVYYTLTCVVIGTIGLEIAHVFYNSFLAHIAPRDYIGRISGWAWGLGYVGGIITLSIALFVFVKNPPSWLNASTAEQIRICGPWAAIWFAFFSLPLFLIVPDIPSSRLSMPQAIKRGFRELGSTIASLPQQKNLLIYLLAHLIYIDGLNTLFAFGGIYAAGTFHMQLSEIILLGITMNVSAGLGAILLAWVDDYLGSKPTILISLVCLIIFGTAILFVKTSAMFWCLGLLLTLFVGPVQAASRSLMVHITPEDKSTEMFGLYAFSGRITAFVGPWLLGAMTLYFQSQRAGMATIMLFLIVGGVLMCFVREPLRASVT